MGQLFCIILAGGTGSRLWPVSREAFPKQMLKLNDEYTLFQRSFLNIASVVNDKNIITAANIKYLSSFKEQLKELQEKFCRKSEYKILTEPAVKNTAPAVTMASKYINDNLCYYSSETPVIVVIPSDKIFLGREFLSDTLEKGIELAKNGYITAFGTQNSCYNNDMIYFKTRKNAAVSQIAPDALKVSEVVSEPEKYDLNKLYLSSGIYMFSYEAYIKELKKYSKDIYSVISNLEISDKIPSVPLNQYELMPDISIEDAIISDTKKLVMVPLQTDWKDIGSWDSVYEQCEKDENGNFSSGKVINIDSENSFVYSTDKLIATLGLKDKIVVSTEDASFICDRKQADSVKKIYKTLNEKNSSTKEIHKTVYRPWGYYTLLECGNGFLTKCITVNPDAKLSLQRHFHRSEHWIVLEGEAVVVKGNDKIILKSGESIDINVEEVHSLQNFTNEQIKIFEVQQGEILDENDIERLEDIYGRI